MYNVDNDQLINDLFRSLRATLTNSFSYSKNHPYFIKSVDNLKSKLEELLAVFNPLKIGITSSGVLVNGQSLTRAGFYDELAQLLHRRKIKSLEISSGITLAELISFFSVISLRQEEINKNGGVSALLDKQQLINLKVEELDYSVFLQETGQECPDVWGYMLKDALESADATKINNLADNFGALIKRSNQDEIFSTEQLPAQINEFLLALKKKDKEKFNQCSQDLFLWLLHKKKSISQEQSVKLRQVFDSLNQEDFSTLFWEALAQEESFDVLSLQFFSRISEQKNPAQIIQGISGKFNAPQHWNERSRVVKKIKDLLSGDQNDVLSPVYRNTLESLVKGDFPSGELIFDQKELREHYRYIVLNIFSTEVEPENLSLAVEILEQELPGVFEDCGWEFLKDLRSQLVKKKKEGSGLGANLERKISVFAENALFKQPSSGQQGYLLEMIVFPGQEINFYLNQIFNVQPTNKLALSLFFKFFPGNLGIFYQRVEAKLQDSEFLHSLVEAVGQLKYPVTLGILAHLYISVNELIKVEIINVMRTLKKLDVEFLMRQLNTKSTLLRKNLLALLVSNTSAGDGALDQLLSIPDFYGKDNAVLIENMQMVFDLGLIEAAGRIHDLSRRKFFWNRQLCAKAKQILKEWHAQ